MTRNLFTLNGIALREIMERTWAEIRADDVFGKAAQLAYYFFLALFPFLICVIASLSVFGSADRGRTLLFDLFARFLPPPAFRLISDTFDEIIQSSGPLKMSFGIVASLWSASLGMGAVMDTLNAAYKVKETRSLIKQYIIAIELTFAIGLLLVGSLLLVVLGHRVAVAFFSRDLAVIVWKIAQWPLGLAMLLLAFAIIYNFGPNLINRRWHWITPGAIAGACMLLIISVGLRTYLHYFGTYNATYGSLGAVIILLLCFYLSGLAVLSGGALNGVLETLPARVETAESHSSVESTSA